jgi:hypothetical protein
MITFRSASGRSGPCGVNVKRVLPREILSFIIHIPAITLLYHLNVMIGLTYFRSISSIISSRKRKNLASAAA